MAELPLSPQVQDTYQFLMWEIKQRTKIIRRLVNAEIGPLPAKVLEEFCYLQLRMICEVIALACLVIHGDLKPKADLLKTYKADWIMSELGKLHPKFYPRPLEGLRPKGSGMEMIYRDPSEYLTKDELRDLWSRESGTVLHRGNVKNVLKDRPPQIAKIVNWIQKVIKMVEAHTLITADEEWVYRFAIYDDDTVEMEFLRLRPGQHPK
jgi:hypothetical protein